jgi:hypothetical protein
LDAVLRLDWLVFTPTCWKRAAVLHRYLALAGVETRIVFGVTEVGPARLIDAHAWLEADGLPILERSPPAFRPLYAFPN